MRIAYNEMNGSYWYRWKCCLSELLPIPHHILHTNARHSASQPTSQQIHLLFIHVCIRYTCLRLKLFLLQANLRFLLRSSSTSSLTKRSTRQNCHIKQTHEHIFVGGDAVWTTLKFLIHSNRGGCRWMWVCTTRYAHQRIVRIINS